MKYSALTKTLFAALLCVAATASTAATRISATFVPGSSGLDPKAHVFTSPQATVEIFAQAPGTVHGSASESPDHYVSFYLASRDGADLQPGAYEDALDSPFGAPWGRVEYANCDAQSRRFVVLESALLPNGDLDRFAANIQFTCQQGAAQYVEIRYNSTVPLTSELPPNSTTPEAFAFTPRTAAVAGEQLVSNEIVVYGINAGIAIGVADGEYSVNDGPWTTTPGTVVNRDRVRVRAVASTTPGGIVAATLTLGTVTGVFNITTYQPGQVQSGLWIQSTPGDFVGEGKTHFMHAPGSDVFVEGESDYLFAFIASAGNPWLVGLSAPYGQTLQPGAFEGAVRGFSDALPGVDIGGEGRGCNETRGRFTVLEAVFGPGGEVQQFAANMVQRCENVGPPLFAELRFNSAVPFTHQKAAGAATPDAFGFLPRAYLQPAEVVESNETVVYGINVPVSISVTGGEYSVNGGAWQSTSGTVVNHDLVRVRGTAPGTPNATQNVMLTVGGVAATFALSTYTTGQPQTVFVLQSGADHSVGQGRTRIEYPPHAALFAEHIGGTEVNVDVDTAEGLWSVRLGGPLGAALAPGAYENAADYSSGVNAPTLRFSGLGVSCTDRGRFTIHEIIYGADGVVDKLAADIVHTCGDSSPAYVELRVNSSLPLLRNKPAGSKIPDNFAFRPRTSVAAGTLVESNEAVIYGINAPAPVAVTNGEYRINGGAWTAVAGNVQNGDRVQVRRFSSGTAGATVSTVLTVEIVPATFNVTTYQPGQVQSVLRYTTGGPAPESRLLQSPDDVFTTYDGYPARFVSATVQSFDDSWGLELTAPYATAMQPGRYLNTVSFPTETNVAGLYFRIPNSDCSDEQGSFTVHEIVRNVDGGIASFAADFERRCGASGPVTQGEIRINSTLPVSNQAPNHAQLAVAKVGTGTGVVTGTGISCGLDCAESYVIGTSVTLTAAPDGDFAFSGWSGVTCSQGNASATCTFTLNANTTATAAFDSGLLARFDFNDDGRSDILLRNTSTGENYLYPMDGTSILAGEGYIRTVPAPWTLAGIGDFDGNGTADLFWRNTSTGENYIYFMNGTNITSEGYIRTVPVAWSVAGVADLDGDGKADILLRNTSSGDNYLYPMDGLTIKGTEGYIRSVPLVWAVAGVADFDGDGKADILLRNTSTGENYLYPMDGTSIKGTEGYIRTVPLAWEVAGLGDFDGDGKADILLRNTGTGENYLYPMDGTSIKGTEGYIRTVPLAWAVASIADFDGDGKVDILLRNTSTGENYLYPMDGTNIKPTEGYIRTVPLAWTVVSK
jgi:hypothetical protein